MNDHDWTRDYAATYLANGLEAEDRGRLETHIGSCAACAAALDEARAFDVSLNEIFAPVRPDPMLEDRVIRGLRTRPTMSPLRRFWIRVGVGVAAVVTVGALGAVVTSDLEDSPQANQGLAAMTRPATRSASDEKLRYGGRVQEIPSNRPSSDAGIPAPSAPVYDSIESEGKMAKKADFGGGWGPGASGGADKAQLESLSRGGEDSNAENALQDLEKAKSLEHGAFRAESDDTYSYKDQLKGGGADGREKQNQYFRPEAAPPPAASPADRAARMADAKVVERKEAGESARKTRAPGSPAPSPAADPGQNGTKPGQEPQGMQARKIIRNGDMEFEIENFDSCVATVMKIVGEEKGYIATVNSEKLENGKVRGEIVLRCPPENLDNLVLKLRGIGDLKGQKITSEDVTKAFYDTDSRLRAAKQMQDRLLEIIKSGKGEIKDLLEAEKQLGEWRQKIEVMEGELRYLQNMVSLCTLKIRLLEKNIRTAASSTETESVSAGIEAEDVEKQYQAALTAVTELKGRVTGSEMKRYEAGQYHARITCEVTPENSGTLRDRLKQLGNVARLDVDRQVTTDGTGTPTGPLKKNDSKFDISIYNIINIAPRETCQVNIACVDAEAVYTALVAKFKDEKSGARIVTSNLNRQRGDRTTGFINFEVKTELADAAVAAVKDAGEVMRLIWNENTDTRNVTKAKKGFQLAIYAMGAVQPRETTIVWLAAKDVAGGYKSLQAEVTKLKGRILTANLNESNPQKLSAIVDCEIRRDDDSAFALAMKSAGDIYSRTSSRSEDSDNVVDSKIRMKLTLVDAANIPPKETWNISIESSDLKRATDEAKTLGKVINESTDTTTQGVMTNTIILEVPMVSAAGPLNQVKGLGKILSATQRKDLNIPDGSFAMTRFNVTITSGERIIAPDDNIGSQIKQGLMTSVKAIGISIKVLIVGVIVILPLGLIAWGLFRLARKQKAAPTA